MNKSKLLALSVLLVLVSLPAISMAQLRPDLLYCGSSSRTGADLYSGLGSLNEVQGCDPTANTQAMLVTRSGKALVSGKGAALLAYLNAGGVIITEHDSSNDVYNEIYGTGYVDGVWTGDCFDNSMPTVKLNPGHDFWQDNTGLTETPDNLEGCGRDLTALVNGEAEVTALGAWTGPTGVSFAIRPQQAGVLFLVDADWQDSNQGYTADSEAFMSVLISGGTFVVGSTPTVPVPSMTAWGLALLAFGMLLLARRRISS